MGVDWITDNGKSKALLYCNTIDHGFGPVIDSIKGWSIDETVVGFLKSLPHDARQYGNAELEDLLNEYADENGGFEFMADSGLEGEKPTSGADIGQRQEIERKVIVDLVKAIALWTAKNAERESVFLQPGPPIYNVNPEALLDFLVEKTGVPKESITKWVDEYQDAK